MSITITKHQVEVLYPPSFGSNAGVQGPQLMMMSAMMAAGWMRRTPGEGPQQGPRGTVPTAPQQLSATSKRLHDGSLAARLSIIIIYI